MKLKIMRVNIEGEHVSHHGLLKHKISAIVIYKHQF